MKRPETWPYESPLFPTPLALEGSNMSSSLLDSPAESPVPRVRHQAREAAVLMAFSAVASVGLAIALLLLSHLTQLG